ncbi:hypothetical protein [Cyclobacterium sediminis]
MMKKSSFLGLGRYLSSEVEGISNLKRWPHPFPTQQLPKKVRSDVSSRHSEILRWPCGKEGEGISKLMRLPHPFPTLQLPKKGSQ